MMTYWLVVAVSILLASVVGAAGDTPEALMVGFIGLGGRTL